MSTRPWFAFYEKGVPTELDLPELLVPQLLSDTAQKFPKNIALRFLLKYLPLGLRIQSTLTYRQLEEATDRFAVALQKMGLRKGDRVALMLPNIPQQVIAYFGILKAGGIVVNVNPTYTSRELQYLLHDAGVETVVLISGFYERLAAIRERTSVRTVILTDVSESLSWPFKQLAGRQLRAKGLLKDIPAQPGLYRFAELMKQATGSLVRVPVQPDDVALFQYSSGTTGMSKAAMLTHRNLVSNTIQIKNWFVTCEIGKEKMLGALPFFHVYGMTVGMLYGLTIGSEVIITPDPRNIDMVLDIIHRERVSIYPGVPAMYIALINHPNVAAYNLRSIKACLSGGAALPVEVAETFMKLTGGRLVEGYGMTEASPVITANPINGQVRVGSIGLPLPNTEVDVVSLKSDSTGNFPPVGVGETGELIVRGPQVMSAYWGRPQETASTIIGGWLYTGDIGYRDEDGYFYIVDRKKDVIIASGYNIVPREIEEILYTHPAVREVTVAGIPDPRRGETVKAYIVLKDGQQATPEELESFCRQQLAPYKVPRIYEFRDDLPKSQVGKVIRRLLVEEEKAKIAQAKTTA
jgi:long-chain acyl-CoA synthetase